MRPIINQINTFDATKNMTVTCIYGSTETEQEDIVSYSNLLQVYNHNGVLVYSNLAYNMRCSNVINAGSLKNGEQYYARVTSYDRDNNPSELSNAMYFYCYSEPIFRFKNVSEGEVIHSQSLRAMLEYEQTDGIDISKCKYELFDASQSLINESAYWSDYEKNDYYDYNGLSNNEIYYIRAHGETVVGQILDTGFINVFIQYEAPGNYSVLYADADNGNGVIEFNTNINIIEPKRDKDTFKYEYGFIDLENDVLVYDQNLLINGDFVMCVRHKSTIGEIMKCSNKVRGFTLAVLDCSDDKYRYKLTVPNEISNYIIFSNEFKMNDTDLLTCWIKRVNNLYELYVFVENDNPDEYNLFLGQIKPGENLAKYDVWIDTDNTPTIRIEKDDVVIYKSSEEPDNPQLNNIWIDIDLEGDGT